MRTTRIDIMDWMREVYDLQGLELIVYALIYSECELTANKIVQLLGIPREDVIEIIKTLRLNGMITYVRGKPEELNEFNSTGDEEQPFFVYSVNEDMLI